MVFQKTTKTTNLTIELSNRNYILEDIPVEEETNSGKEFVSFGDILKAEQKRVANLFEINNRNIFEILTLFADVRSKTDGIKQKFRFNKIIFYLWKRIEDEFGINSLEFDTMYAASAGPIPTHLGTDIENLHRMGLVERYIDKDGKKVPESEDKYQEMMKKRLGSGVVKLTHKGKDLAKKLMNEMNETFGIDFYGIIQKTKAEIIFIDTEKLKDKVHREYPEWQKKYIRNDTENYF